MHNEKQKKPLSFTPRMKRLSGTLFLLYAGIAFLSVKAGYGGPHVLPDLVILSLIWILADILLPLLILFSAMLMSPVESNIQEGFKKQARKKVASMKNLKIIAITGSYGKTSTKFILKTLLAERYNVCFTPGSYNTPMGICKVINNDLQANHQILILEMGARYKGNIRELCEIARPHVSMVTNVGQAHLETFGSVDAIAETKSEILSGLHQNGTAVINSDDKRVAAMPIRDDVAVVRAGLKTGIFEVGDIMYDRNGCRFTITDSDGISATVETRLLGEHNIQNIVQCFATARHFGIRTETMALAASKIEPVEHRLNLIQNGETTIIDDAFNSNPIGARNAVDVLSKFTGGRRILVTPGMVELGEIEKEENRKWGVHIGKSGIDLVILIGKERTKPILSGIDEAEYPRDNVLIFESFFDARKWLTENQISGDIILYENDLPDVYSF